MKSMIRAIKVSAALFVICGLMYPLAMTAISQVIFPKQANGSIIESQGKKIGSELLGQAFTDPRFFSGRVSAVNYNTYTKEDVISDKNEKTAYTGVASGSSNLAPSNPALKERVKKDIEAFLAANPEVKKEDIPADLLTSSGSGLDPHISPAAAKVQIARVSVATGISKDNLNKLVDKYTENRQLGVFGEPRVNIVKLNIEVLDLIK